MKIVKLRIDGQQFFLAEGSDAEALKQHILDAARGVAEFVDFQPVGHGVVSVLMTPQTPVRFEVEERSEEQLNEWASEPPTSDVGAYSYEETPSFDFPDTAYPAA